MTGKAETIEYGFWAYLARDGSLAKITKNRGAVPRDQRAMFLSISVPASIFTEPEMRATITVEESADGAVLSHDTTAKVADALDNIPGVTVEVLTRFERTPAPSIERE